MGKGDRIFAMNGTAIEDIPDVGQVISQCQQLVLKIRRVEEFCITIEKTSVNEKLGIDVDYASSESLTVVFVGKLSQGDHVVPRSQQLVNRLNQAGLQSGPGIVRGVHKDVNTLIGVAVDVRFTDTNKVVEKIPMAWLEKKEQSRGPVERYNALVPPDLCLQDDDTITEVNGLSGAGGKVRSLLAHIAANQKLTLLVKRSNEGALRATESAAQLRPLAMIADDAVTNNGTP